MRSKRSICLPAVALFLTLSQAVSAEKAFQINESAMRAEVQIHAITLTMPVSNYTITALEGTLQIDLLQADENILASSKTEVQLKPGKTIVNAQISLPEESDPEDNDFLWNRIRYQLRKEDALIVSGIIALGAAVPDAFELEFSPVETAFPGRPFHARVRAVHPVTRKAITGAQLKGRLHISFDNSEPVTQTKVTDSAGYASFVFQVPPNAKDDGEINVEARKGQWNREKRLEFRLAHLQSVIGTDKERYQPGEWLHARALVTRGPRQIAPKVPVKFVLEYSRDNYSSIDKKIFDIEAKTNDFGIASIDWKLPESSGLGLYTLALAQKDSESFDYIRGEEVYLDVSRNQWPQFEITAKPDRSYYLPGQNASVEITAGYYFGKDIAKGSVNLSCSQCGGQEQSAVLDKSGRAVFNLDLTEAHKALAREKWNLYSNKLDEAVEFHVDVRDAATDKKEGNGFTLRIARSPVQIYVTGERLDYGLASFYVSTYYPDGMPAECEVDILEGFQYRRPNTDENQFTSARFLRTIKTNRFGVAKITGLPLVSSMLVFEIRSPKGKVIIPYPWLNWSESESFIRLSTDKTIYHKGNTIAVSVHTGTSMRSGRIITHLSRDGRVLWTGQIEVQNGSGLANISYSPQFKGILTISAYTLEAGKSCYAWPYNYRSRMILFPDTSPLKVKITTDKNAYRPGEEMSAAISVTQPSGSPVAAFLGAVIVDKAVEQHIRRDWDRRSNKEIFSWDTLGEPIIGGITLKDLETLDQSKPMPEGLDLVAEMHLSQSDRDKAPEQNTNSFNPCGYQIKMTEALTNAKKALLNENVKNWEFATDQKQLAGVLERAGISIDLLVDPWGTPYRFLFGANNLNRTIEIISAGPDKIYDTDDDSVIDRIWWEYFKPYGMIIDRAVTESYASSGFFIRDIKALQTVLLKSGLNLNALRDPWGNPYRIRFEISGPNYLINVVSDGPPNSDNRLSEPFIVWTTLIDYFEQQRAAINWVLYQYFRTTGSFPQSRETFEQALTAGRIAPKMLVDPWGNPYFQDFEHDHNFDTLQIIYRPEKPDPTIFEGFNFGFIHIWSAGPDGQVGTADDFLAARFTQAITRVKGYDHLRVDAVREPASGGGGAIQGAITQDKYSAAGRDIAEVTDAIIVACSRQTGQAFTVTSSGGRYEIRDIPSGIYDLSIALSENNVYAIVRDLPVNPASATTFDIRLPSSSCETCSVARIEKPGQTIKTQEPEKKFTPRLRTYFPDTLYWAPSLMTDSQGHARLKIKLADNITTWRISVLASTKSGEIGAAEAEIEAFQPFFLEHDPPKILTLGDEIELPVLVRNYLPEAQTVDVQMKPASWLQLQQHGKRKISVASGGSQNAYFIFKTTDIADSGKQQVYAANTTYGDAIEKPVRVHHAGMDQHSSASGILGMDDTLLLQIDPDLTPASLRAHLKVYPNLLANLTESLEAGLIRPHGCAEQIISSAYPNLLLLNFYKESGRVNPVLKSRAENNLRLGYEKLLESRDITGGFRYWKDLKPDIAVTSYALVFLTEASSFIEVNPETVSAAVAWLISQQDKDGRWIQVRGRDADLTAYVTAALTAVEGRNHRLKDRLHEPVSRALRNLSNEYRQLDSPYALSKFAMAAEEVGDRQKAAELIGRLSKLAIREQDGFYWKGYYSFTPFYGWGHAGNVENTAFAVLALLKSGSGSAEIRRLIDGGTRWLIRQKDRYGVWLSGQATVAVLSVLVRMMDSDEKASGGKLAVSVNGRPVNLDISSLPSDSPSVLDISDLLRPGENQIQTQASGMYRLATILAVADYYLPYTEEPAPANQRSVSSEEFRLMIQFDKTEAKAGEKVDCTVEVERLRNRDGGMLIVEVGLPPGAESPDWVQSEALPDRRIFYLWAGDKPARFTFPLWLRYAMKARTPPSKVYDYYNPDAQLSLLPFDFVVRREN